MRADFFPAPPGQTGGHALQVRPPAESAGQGRAGAPDSRRQAAVGPGSATGSGTGWAACATASKGPEQHRAATPAAAHRVPRRRAAASSGSASEAGSGGAPGRGSPADRDPAGRCPGSAGGGPGHRLPRWDQPLRDTGGQDERLCPEGEQARPGAGRYGHEARRSPDTVAGSEPRRGAAPGRGTASPAHGAARQSSGPAGQPSRSAGQPSDSVSSAGGQPHDQRDSESNRTIRGDPGGHEGRRKRLQPRRRCRPKAAQSQAQPEARWGWMMRMMTAASAHRQSPSDGR